MSRSSSALLLRGSMVATMVAAMFTIGASSARAVSYTWASLSAGGDWTTAANWNPNTGYPGLTLTGTDVALFNQDITGNQSVNLDASVGIQNLFLGDTAQTAGTFNTIAISTTNGSALTFNAPAATNISVLSMSGGVDAGTENVIAPNINLTSGTLEFRNNLISGGGANGRLSVDPAPTAFGRVRFSDRRGGQDARQFATSGGCDAPTRYLLWSRVREGGVPHVLWDRA